MSLRGDVPSKAEAILQNVIPERFNRESRTGGSPIKAFGDDTSTSFACNDDGLNARNRGFSILEMIVVLALMALILGIFLVRSGGLSEQKKIETAKGDLRAIESAIHSYYLHHANSYPSGSDWFNNDLVNDTPRVLKQILYDPFRAANTEYSYSLSPDGKYYVVFSYGPDQAADISGIDNNAKLTGQSDDDIYVTNGTGTFA